MGRILDQRGRSLVLAMDHGQVYGSGPPLDEGKVGKMLSAGVDAVLTTIGTATRMVRTLSSVGLILRVDGGRSNLSEPREDNTGRLLFSVDAAVRLGADGVAAMAYPGHPLETRMLRDVGRLVEAARDAGLVVMVEVIPFGFGGKDRWDAKTVAAGSRIVSEIGVDLVKTVKPLDGNLHHLVEECPVPILVLGGAAKMTDDDVVALGSEVVVAGGSGLAIGRNLWGAEDPVGLVQRVSTAIHGPG